MRGLIKILTAVTWSLIVAPFFIGFWVDSSTLKGIGDFVLLGYLLISVLSAVVMAVDQLRRGEWIGSLMWAVFTIAFCILALPCYLQYTKPATLVE